MANSRIQIQRNPFHLLFPQNASGIWNSQDGHCDPRSHQPFSLLVGHMPSTIMHIAQVLYGNHAHLDEFHPKNHQSKGKGIRQKWSITIDLKLLPDVAVVHIFHYTFMQLCTYFATAHKLRLNQGLVEGTAENTLKQSNSKS